MNQKSMSHSMGIDVGSSGIRILILNAEGEIIVSEMTHYSQLTEAQLQVWNTQKLINLDAIISLILHLITQIAQKYTGNISTIGISSIGPSLVLLDQRFTPICYALNYAYQGAEKYIQLLPRDFQEVTGCFYSSSLPIVQLLEMAEKGYPTNLYKITSINDYLVAFFAETSIEDVFMTLPNASYSGLCDLKEQTWNQKMLALVNLTEDKLPKIIPLGQSFEISQKWASKFSFFSETKIVSGAIDGFDAFWAAGVYPQNKTIVGSASTTGALRRWRNTPRTKFSSRSIICAHILPDAWIELIPFNNVGVCFQWLLNNYPIIFQAYRQSPDKLDLERLDREAINQIIVNGKLNRIYLENLPFFFPYIEGEPRGPMARGSHIPGGFFKMHKKNLKNNLNLELGNKNQRIEKNKKNDNMNEYNAVDLYIATILGITCMYHHNLQVLNPPLDFQELRLTGIIAQKCEILRIFISHLSHINICLPEAVQSVAWASGMRALLYCNYISVIPTVKTCLMTIPKMSSLHQFLRYWFAQYQEVYEHPHKYFQ